MQKIGLKILTTLLALLFAFALAEIAVRDMGYFDENKNFFFKDTVVPPYKAPVVTVQNTIDKLKRNNTSIFIYDPDLGWTYRPNGKSENGMYFYNSQKIRSGREFAEKPENNVLRIAMFGDSFTHSDEVPLQESLAFLLEQRLNSRGLKTEVLNFGVGGYAMDQAYLRWQKEGKRFHPHIVIFGLQLENLTRNENLIRPLYQPSTKLPFSKPRFILENNQLKLINSPTPSIEETLNILKNINHWDLSKYELYYNSSKYKNNFYYKSKFLSILIDKFTKESIKNSNADQSEELGLKIIEKFNQDVVSEKSKFYIAFLPRVTELKDLARDQFRSDLLISLAENFDLILPEKLIEKAKNVDSEKFYIGHYNKVGNELVAETLAEKIFLDASKTKEYNFNW